MKNTYIFTVDAGIIEQNAFSMATDNPEILIFQHLRKIVPRTDMYDLTGSFAISR
jgi:hypothetical protein